MKITEKTREFWPNFRPLKNSWRHHVPRHMQAVFRRILHHQRAMFPSMCQAMSPVTCKPCPAHVLHHYPTVSPCVCHHTNGVFARLCLSCLLSLRIYVPSCPPSQGTRVHSLIVVLCPKIAHLCPDKSRITSHTYPTISHFTNLTCPPFSVHCV